MKKKVLFFIIICLVVFGSVKLNSVLSTTYVNADYLEFATMNEMAEYVDVVALVKIKKVHPSFIRTEKEVENLNFIETDSEIEIEAIIKGNVKKGETLTLKQDGGIVGNEKQIWTDTHYVKETERFLVFLMHLPNGKYAAMNPTQGILRIDNRNVISFMEKEYNPQLQ